MKNNKGFSLIEMIIAISILIIVASLISLNSGIVLKWQLNRCIDAIDDNLNSVKVTSLSDSQKDSTLELSETDGQLYMSINENDDIKLGAFDTTVYYEDINRDNQADVDVENQSITIGFNKNGEFDEISEISGMYVKSIEISKGNHTKKVICERLTGKHYISE